MQGRSNLVPGLLAVAAVMFAISPFLIDAAPYESAMGLIQRIFYYHVPSAMVMFASAFVCGIASAIYLAKRSPEADATALAEVSRVPVRKTDAIGPPHIYHRAPAFRGVFRCGGTCVSGAHRML